MVNCRKCDNPLTDADRMGLSFICTKCGGVTRPDDTSESEAPQEKAKLSDARRQARLASRILLGLLVSFPVIVLGLVFAAEAAGLGEEVFKGGASVFAIIVFALTAFAHKLREAAVEEDGKSYWANLL